ncbi:restriction endonuclease subunit S [Bifidobacterium longum]|uniref:restriction endonuclease subunit S n=1 Tax=Bifidobacterium longum TaxID=216816 RepID=UPI001BCEB323
MTEQAKVPAIRFAGFTDPWEQRKLGDIAERVTRKNENNESDLPLTISAQHGLIDQRLFFNAQVASRDMSGYYLLRQGEFAYNKSTSADSPWGAIKRLTRYEKGCVSTLYICFALLNANPDYLVTYYETNRWHKAVQMIAAEGARNHGLLNIAPDDFFDTMVSLPESQAEQQTIGAFFSRLDSLITLHQRKYDKLVIFKKSMLEKMFPKDGESVPEIRFAGFTDPWEQRELVDIAEIVGGGTPDTNNSNYWDGDIDWYAPAELGNNIYAESSTRKITQAGFDSCSTKMLPADKTILFTSRAGIGNTAILRHSACTNQGFQSLVIGDADVYFVYSMSERIKKWAEEKASGSTFLEISGRQLETMPVNLPSLVEQQAIGSFFSHLDDLITLHQRKLELLQNIKKSLLDKMFA